MPKNMIVTLFAFLFCFSVSSFAQEKTSPISPSDIPVDQIKNAAQIKAEQEKAAKQAAAKKAESSKAPAKPAAKPNDQVMKDSIAPSPSPEATIAEGTMVAEPCCGCDTPAPCGTVSCQPACDPCASRGKFMNRIRSMFQRRCCR